MAGLKNIPLRLFQEFLQEFGLKRIRINGGHEVWSRKDLNRPVIVQTHEDPVPEFIVRNTLKIMRLTRKDFEKWYLS